MRIQDVRPFPEPGQWWTKKDELLLYQVTMPGDGLHVLKVWHPVLGISDSHWVGSLGQDWTYLWFSGVVSADYLKGLDPFRVGDAYVTGEGQVFFLGGVDRNKETVTILADEMIIIEDRSRTRKLLAGPADPADEPLSAFERILADESIPQG